MGQTSDRTVKTSGIPRPSRLPILQGNRVGTDQAPSVKYSLPSRTLPRKPLQAVDQDASSKQADSHLSTESPDEKSGSGISGDSPVEMNNAGKDPAEALEKARTLPRRPRPSLSDRTIETLSQIPPSPSPSRRRSSYFSSQTPVQSPSRPASSLSQSRPSTNHSYHPSLNSGFPTQRPASPTKRPPISAHGTYVPQGTPSKRGVSSSFPLQLTEPNAKMSDAFVFTPAQSKSALLHKNTLSQNSDTNAIRRSPQRPIRGSKTLAARPSKPRPSVKKTFEQSTRRMPDNIQNGAVERWQKPTSTAASINSVETRAAFSPKMKTSSRDVLESPDPAFSRPRESAGSKALASSAQLRETIAQAKAARRNASKAKGTNSLNSKQTAEGFPIIEISGNDKGLLRKRVAMARTDGRLNIAALGLKEIPPEVINMYDPDSADAGDTAWYESVDLVKVIAADNDIGQIDSEVFPDISAEDSSSISDEYRGNIFGGLEILDLHGNRLNTVPVGLRRLENLTNLNISKNQLGNEALDVISQIRSLRDLRLSENAFSGTLPHQLCDLENLEILDVGSNKFSNIPDDVRRLSRLRVLLVAGNKLTSLPFESLSSLPLIEVDAARNSLNGSLFTSEATGLAYLRTLDASHNALTSIKNFSTIDMPSIQSVNVTENRIAVLPDISGWPDLLTLIAGGNQLTSLPDGIFSLQKLKTVDVSRNDIKKLDERLGLMEGLTILRIANNPLRERKFLTMDTDNLKSELRHRLFPEEPSTSLQHDIADERDPDPAYVGASGSWPIKPGGILDRSSTGLKDLDSSIFTTLADDIKNLILHHNILPKIPEAIALTGRSLTTLDLSNNKLGGDTYVLTPLALPNLKSLDLSANGMTSLEPLQNLLSSPKLSKLNVSRNRLGALPILRSSFPLLRSLNASNNRLSLLEVEAIRGLEVVDVGANSIQRLEPKIGLLGSEGLRTLVVSGNTFKVPRRDVIEKGTEAVLTWLKSRIPEGEHYL